MRDGFRYKAMPIGEDGTAHLLRMDERRSLKYAVDLTWGESTEREITLPVKVEKPAVRLTKGGAPPTRVVQTRKTFDQEVLELKLVDKPIPAVPERPPGWEDAAVLRPEDVLGRLPTEPDATASDASDTAREELPGEPPAREPATPREQTVPAPGLSAVLQSQTEGMITAGEGEQSRQVRYEGPRFQVSGDIRFNVSTPVNPSPALSEYKGEDEPVGVENISFLYPSEVLIDELGL